MLSDNGQTPHFLDLCPWLALPPWLLDNRILGFCCHALIAPVNVLFFFFFCWHYHCYCCDFLNACPLIINSYIPVNHINYYIPVNCENCYIPVNYVNINNNENIFVFEWWSNILPVLSIYFFLNSVYSSGTPASVDFGCLFYACVNL